MKTLGLVTVVFERDVAFFELQLKSIAKFVPPGLFTTFVVVTQEDDTSLHDRLLPLVQTLIDPSIISHIKVVPQRHLTSLNLEYKGWYTQQFLKLAAASLVGTDDYLVLDSKVHFIRPVTRDLFYTNGKPRAWDVRISSLHEVIWKGYQKSCDEFDVDWTFVLTKTNKDIAPMTPFVLITDEVIDMMSELETKHNASFDEVFMKRCEGVTEFYLYSAFLRKKYGSMYDIYHIDDVDRLPHLSIFDNTVKDKEKFFRQMRKVMTAEIFTFALHPNTTSLLTEDMYPPLIHLWIDRGLLNFDEIRKVLNLIDKV